MKFIHTSVLLCISLVIFSCTQKDKNPEVTSAEQSHSSARDSVFISPYGGYGYAIIVNDKVRIYQPHIPVVASQIGFASAQDARKTARLVIAKIGQDQFLPQLSYRELEDLGIISSRLLSGAGPNSD
jgi:hypothetical protein